MRKYAGDADIYDIVPTKKRYCNIGRIFCIVMTWVRYNFSFFPTGTKC